MFSKDFLVRNDASNKLYKKTARKVNKLQNILHIGSAKSGAFQRRIFRNCLNNRNTKVTVSKNCRSHQNGIVFNILVILYPMNNFIEHCDTI